MKRYEQGSGSCTWRMEPEKGKTELEAVVDLLLRLPAETIAYYRFPGEPEGEGEETAFSLVCTEESGKVLLEPHTVYVWNRNWKPQLSEEGLYVALRQLPLWENEARAVSPGVKERLLEWLETAPEPGNDYFRYALLEEGKEPLHYTAWVTVFAAGADRVLCCALADLTDCESRKQEERADNENEAFHEVTEFAYELLDGKGNTSAAIPAMLGKIGDRYGFDMVTIHAKKPFEGGGLSEYIWKSESLPDIGNAELDKETWALLETLFAEKKVLEYADIEEAKEYEALYGRCKNRGIKALLQAPIYREGALAGVMSFVDCDRGRVWSSAEKHFLYLTSRLLSGHVQGEMSKQEAEEKIEQLTGYDEVTGLYGYNKFRECAERILAEADPETRYAIVYTDFVNFKFFNEMYGFQEGDKLLREFANHVSKYNSHCVAACRNHADHFIVMTRTAGEEELQERVESYNSIFAASQAEKYMDVTFSMTSGAYIMEPAEKNILTALENANLARKIKKEKKAGGYLMYRPEMKKERIHEISMLNMLEEAMEDDEIVLYLQPKISLADGTLAGAEALARWKKPNGGISMPGEFIPLLEKSGKIVDLDFYMFEALARLLRRWKRRGYPLVPISVNLSRHNIKNPRLAERLATLATQYDVPKDMIEVEITESAFVEDQEGLLHTIHRIFKEGFEVSIDDFGKGYSSLNMLTEVPASVVKIDKDFLRGGDESERAQKLIVNIIRLIKDSSMTVVCEGVETEEQVEFLKQAGCDIVQGFYYAKPMRPEEFEMRYFKGTIPDGIG